MIFIPLLLWMLLMLLREKVDNEMNTDTIWIYSFDDGTEFELLNIGFSIQEIIMLEKLHGKCFATHERVRM